MGHVEDAPDNGTPQESLAAVAERLAAIGAELAVTYAATSAADRQQVGDGSALASASSTCITHMHRRKKV
jgi:hypothetical protein